MSAVAGGGVQYVDQLASTMKERSSFDQSAPYTTCCTYNGYSANGGGGILHSFCMIGSYGAYSVGDAATKVLLAKNVSVSMEGCFVEVFGNENDSLQQLDVYIYIGTPDEVLSASTVYLYRYTGYVYKGGYVRVDIPDVSSFVVPSGKNVVVRVGYGTDCLVNGHFVCSVDD